MVTIWDLDKAFRNCWRAIVEAPACDEEQVVFVDAPDREAAHKSVQHLIAAMFPNLTGDQIENAYCNLYSIQDLLENGTSETPEHRLFEYGWHDYDVEYWAKAPIFAVPNPTAYFKAWHEAVASFEAKKIKRELVN